MEAGLGGEVGRHDGASEVCPSALAADQKRSREQVEERQRGPVKGEPLRSPSVSLKAVVKKGGDMHDGANGEQADRDRGARCGGSLAVLGDVRLVAWFRSGSGGLWVMLSWPAGLRGAASVESVGVVRHSVPFALACAPAQ
ncbi:hypothetical protein [Streptomyces sp. NBC_01443]|uniref:hypothetical protein n=1 Tax=Streptomyces sp. NBC_01443 TaxID=2903868 RepID=UPI0022590EC6|nr:hypothetical protein [Streptomyces sp. NBC_01443]MCX4632274.1 hypothetical protein [Streptomyces sp. NBC_01443]